MSATRKPDAGPTDEDTFREALAKHGIALDPDEAASVLGLARWMRDGVVALHTVRSLPAADSPASADPSLVELSIPEAGRQLREGRLTSVALTRAHLARIAERDPDLHAFFTLSADTALAAARRADDELRDGIDRGPLHGIPVAVKDLIDVAGLPTTAGSRARAAEIAAANAPAVQRLVDGGAVILGKLATYEWGTVGPAFDLLFPPARNPWDRDRITGGSSSGCAAATAARLVRTSIGTDTGGSLRSPAAYCGAVGLNPTRGLVPKDGALPLAPSMDNVGPISTTVAEAALTLDVLTGRADSPDAAASALGEPVEGLRLGYARNWFASDPQADPAIIEAMDAAVSRLSMLGAVVRQVDLPDYRSFEAAGAVVLHKEAFEIHGADLAAHPERYGRKTLQTLSAGIMISEAEYAEALRASDALRQRIDALFDDVDAIVTVCTLTTALPVAAFGKDAVWTPMRTIGFNLTGHPVLALPIDLCDGLPAGMQIIGRHFGEAVVCRVGHAYEQAAGHREVRPPEPIERMRDGA